MIMKNCNLRLWTFLSIALCAAFFNKAAANTSASQDDEKMKGVKSVTRTVTTTRTETIFLPVDSIPDELTDTLSSAPKEGGKLIWIPDSLTTEVKTLLKGHSRVVDDPFKLDPDEKVVFRGDTLPMVLKQRNLGRYDRGLFNFLFIPKGTWHFGLTASYAEFSTDDLSMLDLINDVDLNAHAFSIRPYLGYFIRSNLSVGVRMSYQRTVGRIDSFKVDIDEDMNFNLHDIGYRSESYSAAVYMQQYMGLGRRGRFGVFNEVELSFSSGNSDFDRPSDGIIRRTHTTNMQAALTFSPGVCVFIMENVSFNVSFGVFGFNIRHEKQTENDVPSGNRFTSGANFRINLFNLAFGIGIHI